MKNRILPKVISNKLSQFEQKASVLVPTRKMRCLRLSLYFFAKNRSHALLCKEKCKRLVSEKCRGYTQYSKIAWFLFYVFLNFLLKKIKVAMFSAFHIVRLETQ